MESSNTPVKTLRVFLQSLPHTGSISAEVWRQLCPLLFKAWDSLAGKEQQKTFADKLHRAEGATWHPPLLTFTLERHGSTVHGSTRAELHHWQVDVDAGVAAIEKIGGRQLYAMDSRLDVAKLARETRKRIVAGENHDCLKWVDETYVLIVIGQIIPETNAQTTSSRRKRFRAALDQEMAEVGWQRADQGNRRGYRRIASAVQR